MKHYLIISLFSLVIVSFANAESKDEATVKAAAEDFYGALNAMFGGDVEPMLGIWSHADDVAYMGPMGGIEIGWDKVRPLWVQQASLKLGGTVESSDMHIVISDDIAVIHNLEVGHNVDKNGKRVTVSIRATNIFRKENGAWKMIAHHTDLLPFLTKEMSK